jgi:hypothetical protein
VLKDSTTLGAQSWRLPAMQSRIFHICHRLLNWVRWQGDLVVPQGNFLWKIVNHVRSLKARGLITKRLRVPPFFFEPILNDQRSRARDPVIFCSYYVLSAGGLYILFLLSPGLGLSLNLLVAWWYRSAFTLGWALPAVFWIWDQGNFYLNLLIHLGANCKDLGQLLID